MNTMILPTGSPAEWEAALVQAQQRLRSGGVVAFPTDTVYGVGARVDDAGAIAQLYRVKERELAKAIPVLVGDPVDLAQVAVQAGGYAARLAACFWPGPLTLVVPRNPVLPPVLGAEPTVGVRMPAHPLALALLRRTGPLAVTSANLSGQPNATTAGEVAAQLAGRIDLILDGGTTPGGVPSTVVDCTGTELRVLRVGPISTADLEAALNDSGLEF